MKKIVVVLVSLVVAILVIGGNAFAHIPDPSLGPEWKFIAIGYDGGSYYINTKKITHSPNNIAKVWVLKVERGGWRRWIINGLKYDLRSRGEDPNKAERYWYDIELYKFNCTTHEVLSSTTTFYSFKKTPLIQESMSLGWRLIPHTSIGIPDRKIENYVCNEVPISIPEPSLGPEWKLIGINLDGTRVYINTKDIMSFGWVGFGEATTLLVPRGETRERMVHALKEKFFSEGKYPNKARSLWYVTVLYEVRCDPYQIAILEITPYSFKKTALDYEVPHTDWLDISPGSLYERIGNYICKEHK